LFWTATDLELKLLSFRDTITIDPVRTQRWRVRLRSRTRSPNERSRNFIAGKHIVVVYTKRQLPHEQEFATDRRGQEFARHNFVIRQERNKLRHAAHCGVYTPRREARVQT